VKIKMYVKKIGEGRLLKCKFYTNTKFTYGVWTIEGAYNLIWNNMLHESVSCCERLDKWCV
jgi:hypothetical protein